MWKKVEWNANALLSESSFWPRMVWEVILDSAGSPSTGGVWDRREVGSSDGGLNDRAELVGVLEARESRMGSKPLLGLLCWDCCWLL